ncbi:MAG: tRNA (adenosine(37)-N6)-threonylcarbamoyltransferase complex dimerization subunit type 1 TsaB, partial [Deltaproteobacteria bacterium]|nr:tRNA (adenosine(37)-N6)-threonylcarbamoyltransferase complex dimerization subunit type 1 TsaB [Deltaproteobacteria bacterium]
MIILALDTATPVTSVALLDDNQLLGQVSEPSKNHSRTLLIAIDRLVSQLGLARHDLGAIAVGLGPGSFTGIRVGLTLAKSLSFALRIPLAGVSTLRALAENGKSQG